MLNDNTLFKSFSNLESDHLWEQNNCITQFTTAEKAVFRSVLRDMLT